SATSRSPRVRRERGVALAALLASITILFIGMGVAAAGWDYVKQNEDEQELLFRGMQIVKAIERLQLKNERPPSLKYLVNRKELPHLYTDPMSKGKKADENGNWRYTHGGGQQDVVNGGAPGVPGAPPPRTTRMLTEPPGMLAWLLSRPAFESVDGAITP